MLNNALIFAFFLLFSTSRSNISNFYQTLLLFKLIEGKTFAARSDKFSNKIFNMKYNDNNVSGNQKFKQLNISNGEKRYAQVWASVYGSRERS